MTGTGRAGAVAIGRNEGERLHRCLESIRAAGLPIVYVDSGSTDTSVALARELGAEVVVLDPSQPFSAARARNAGLARLSECVPQVEWVLFVDGDCELVDGFVPLALEHLQAAEDCAVVFGRRRERYPERSIYNHLCDIEWGGEAGDATACGGDSLMRVAAVDGVGGFDPSFIGGEEPELCFRLRAAGWRIQRIAEAMTIHDAAMTRASQWWRRAMRAGHAYAQSAHRHGRSAEGFRRAELRSIVLWSLLIPFASVTAALFHLPGWLLLGLYPLQVVRIRRSPVCSTLPPRSAWLYAVSCVASKFPEALGAARFHQTRLRGSGTELIEYK